MIKNISGQVVSCLDFGAQTLWVVFVNRCLLKFLVFHCAVLSVRFEVHLGVSLLLEPVGADKRGPKPPFPLVEDAGMQPAIQKRIPAGAPAGARSY